MLKNTLTVMGLGFGLLACSSNAKAAVVIMDPDGPTGISGDVAVGMIDFLPGNALNKDALINPAHFTNYYQARVGSLTDANGVVIPLAGLNDASSSNKYELTVVSRFDLDATYYPTPMGYFTNTQLSPIQTVVNFFTIYYDPSMNANDLLGTGFDDGTPIMSGTVTYFNGNFGESTQLPPVALDQFGVDNYPNTLSNIGNGGTDTLAVINVTPNPNFIKSNVWGMYVSSSNTEPYRQVDPSNSFMGIPANVGAVNGRTGPDVIVQADASASFIVPEPGSLAILGISAAGLFIRRRK